MLLGTAVASAAAALVGRPGRAQPAAVNDDLVARQLPLDAVGLEHIGTVVPDVSAAAAFFGRVFNPELFKERNPPLRYYVTLDPGYIAIGARDGVEAALGRAYAFRHPAGAGRGVAAYRPLLRQRGHRRLRPARHPGGADRARGRRRLRAR